ncbi:GH3 auxin-responsive promoter family protein [Cytophaga aurantiaca]|uniref:GH3 auxin-responsive promoter family protein n=1 Tax=Cytophaga aurantiaca TaxID=29530 RepID=UPI00036E6C3C|nr:GH3 auxin-responsive promoter family protein [Cytophaga aurantiaca]
MGIRSILSKLLARQVVKKQKYWSERPIETQNDVLQYLLSSAKKTAFGIDHNFESIRTHEDYCRLVPIREYEGFVNYIEEVKKGTKDVLWPGIPLYFAKTSGTTSGVKYIPITKESIPHHINGAKNALLNYVYSTGKSTFLDKKLIFLSGSPVMEKKNGIYIGRLSGIVNHHVPGYLRGNQLPSFETNCMDDWEKKLDRIVDETIDQEMSLISGIPPWIQMYFDTIHKRTGKKIKDVFPSFSLLVYGGVNFAPYKKKLMDSIGKDIDTIETYPASEGFIAFQDQPSQEGLLLLLNSGVFYEFVPVEEYGTASPTRLTIGQVELGVNYALIMSTNAGLFGYSIGDTVKFVSKNPHRIVVSGRVKHYISAFGEHVIGEEVEQALKAALEKHPETSVTEFTVAPQVTPAEGLPYHEWFIEFISKPANPTQFALDLDQEMVKRNIYYKDLIVGNVLRPLVITVVTEGGFINGMKKMGKLGGQNKSPRLSNDRNFVNAILN